MTKFRECSCAVGTQTSFDDYSSTMKNPKENEPVRQTPVGFTQVPEVSSDQSLENPKLLKEDSAIELTRHKKSVSTSTDWPFNGNYGLNTFWEGESKQLLNPSTDTNSEENISKSQKTLEAEKLSLARELDYVKQMLRSQTQVCEIQQEEITRLTNELHLSEQKYQESLSRINLHLKIFQEMESRTKQLDGKDEYKIPNEETGSKKKNLEAPKNEPPQRETTTSTGASTGEKIRFLDKKFLDSSDDDDSDQSGLNHGRKKFSKSLGIRGKSTVTFQGKAVTSQSSLKIPLITKFDRLGSESSESTGDNGSLTIHNGSKDRRSSVDNYEKELTSSQTSPKSYVVNRKFPSMIQEIILICIEWLKLEPETSVWYNESIKLLFVDFTFLDLKGEETETPCSLKKPKKPAEKCHFNFLKHIEITDYRRSALQALKTRSESDLIVFKVVSEPEESTADSECVDIGVATVTVKQFFESKHKTSLLLHVRNINDAKEIIGILSVSLEVPQTL